MGVSYDQCACGCKHCYYDDHESWTTCNSEIFLEGQREYDEEECYSGCGAKYICHDGEVRCQQCTDDPERVKPTDERLLEYILEKQKKTRDELVEEFKKSLTPSSPPPKRACVHPVTVNRTHTPPCPRLSTAASSKTSERSLRRFDEQHTERVNELEEASGVSEEKQRMVDAWKTIM